MQNFTRTMTFNGTGIWDRLQAPVSEETPRIRQYGPATTASTVETPHRGDHLENAIVKFHTSDNS